MSGQFDPRITAYFGDAVLQAGFMPLPHLFLRHYRALGLSQVQAMFVLQIMEIAWDVGDPPNTVSKIATRMGLSQRSVRACSKEVHDLGLVEIYDQWDDAGAQVENAYDLGPLFRRLADLVPPQIPGGQQRMRRQREARASNDAAQSDTPPVSSAQRVDTTIAIPMQKPAPPTLQESASRPMKNPARGGMQIPASSPLKNRAAAPGTLAQGSTDPTITGPRQKGSALKEKTKKTSKKLSRNHQEHHGGGVQPLMPELEPEPVGWSLRWNVALSADDIGRSRTILDRAGLHTLVAQRAAPTLAPAECWSLVCYARAASLGPAWIATQVYDWTTRTPRTSTLNRRYDDAGRALAALGDEQADAILDITSAWCPQDVERWQAAVDEVSMTLVQDARPSAKQAADAVWNVMAEQRHAPPSHTTGPRPPSPLPAAGEYDEQWSSVRDALRGDLSPGDWRSWVEPLALLDIEQDVAVVGAPNVFVRNEVEARYAASLQQALASAFGRDIQLELVIGTAAMS